MGHGNSIRVVGWLGTAQGWRSSKSNGNTETKGTKQFIVVVVERTGAAGATAEAKDPNGIARRGRVFNGSGADGRTSNERTHRGRRKRPKTMAISSSIFVIFFFLFRNIFGCLILNLVLFRLNEVVYIAKHAINFNSD